MNQLLTQKILTCCHTISETWHSNTRATYLDFLFQTQPIKMPQ